MADPRFKYIEIKVGLFILSAIITIIAIVFAIGVDRNIFVSKVDITVLAQTADGLSKGMSVKYSGFAISRVDSVKLRDDGKVVISIGIPRSYTKWIKQDSVFKLSALSFIGSGEIAISTDFNSEALPVANGDIFELTRDGNVQALIDQATPVVEDLSEIVNNINVILYRVADEDGDVNKFLRGLGQIGDDFNDGGGTIGYLTRSPEIVDELRLLLDDIRTFRTTAVRFANTAYRGGLAFHNAMTMIDNNTEPVVTNVYDASIAAKLVLEGLLPILDQLKVVSEQLDQTTQNTMIGTKNLDELRAEIQSVVSNGNRLLMELQGKWIFTQDKVPTEVPLK